MKILIANANIQVFTDIKKDLKISPSTVNTSIITCSKRTFEKIHAEVRSLGYNPYALMYW